MRINKYDIILNDDRIVSLVKEKGINYHSDNQKLDCPSKVADLIINVFNSDKMPEEHLYLICLRTDNSVIGVFNVGHGTVSSALFNPREIMVRALLCGAPAIILIHNHPSGDPTPSKYDVNATNQLLNASNIIGINLLDHIIIGDHKFYSFKEHEKI